MACLCQRPVTAHGCSGCPLWQPCAATGRWHYSIVRTMTPWNHALRVSFVCSKAWVVLPLLLFCWYCCNSDGRFATLFEICGYDCCDSSIEICFGKAAYIFGVAERVLGVGEESWILAVLDGRYVAGNVRRGRCGWRLPNPAHICIPHVGTTTPKPADGYFVLTTRKFRRCPVTYAGALGVCGLTAPGQ